MRMFKKKYPQGLSPLAKQELEKICQVALWLDGRHAIPATSSNFSYRCDKDQFWITRSGLHKRDLKPHHFLAVDCKGRPLQKQFVKPSDETQLHAMVYELFPQMNAVLHCHAIEIETARVPAYTLRGHELLKALGLATHTQDLIVPVFKNSQDMAALSKEITGYYKKHNDQICFAFILEHHGIYCFGKTVDHARNSLEVILHLMASHQFI